MKLLIALALVCLTSSAQAMGMGMHGGGHPGAMHGAIALYAVLAALGYWVLQHAMKETANLVKRTGAVVGLLLVVIGLAGMLCGVGSHIKNSMGACECGGGMKEGMMMQGGMMMHGKDCKMGEMPAMSEDMKPVAPEKKKTK